MTFVPGAFGRAQMERRNATGSVARQDSWNGLDDSSLLGWLHSLPANHDRDADLLEIVGSRRHLYVRQVAAVAVCNPDHLLAFLRNRELGPVLTRQLSRVEDVAYLADLVQSSRHPEVRRVAKLQLQELSARLLQPVHAPTK